MAIYTRAFDTSRANNHFNDRKKKNETGQRPISFRIQARAKFCAAFIRSSLVLSAVAAAAAATAAIATLGAWLRFVDIQRATIQILAVKAADGSNSLVF